MDLVSCKPFGFGLVAPSGNQSDALSNANESIRDATI
jgi:hypothetical protein